MKQPYLPVLNRQLLPLRCILCGKLTKPAYDYNFEVVCELCWDMGGPACVYPEIVQQHLLEIELELERI